MSRWMERIQNSGTKGLASFVVASMILVGCGGGDDDADPTATSELVDAQPTVVEEMTPETASDQGTAGAPENTDLSSDRDDGTPIVAGGTPMSAGQTSPTDDDRVDTATPNASPMSEVVSGVVDSATPATSEAVPGETVNTGDGTIGATPDAASDNVSTDAIADILAETILASPASGTPVASSDLAVVDSCSPGVVPPFTGDEATFVLNADLNFRSGPGADCDLIGTGPLGEFSQVAVVSSIVIREGEEDTEWVQIQVGDDLGWVAFEFLEPVN